MKEAKRSRRSLPIFVKCLVILVVACGILAATLTFLSDRASRAIARIGIDALAGNLTEIAATDIAGSVRFRDIPSTEERLKTAMGTTGMSNTFLVIDANGQVLTAYPNDLDEDVLSRMAELAASSLENDRSASSDNGLIVAVPIRIGAEKTTIGSLAIVWDPVAMFSEIEASKKQMILAGIAVVLTMSGMAILAVRKTITNPLLVVNLRTLQLAEGDLESTVPMTSRTDEIGSAAQALEVLRVKLDASEKAKRDAFLQGSGFQSTATAMLICDADLKITHANKAYLQFVQGNIDCLREKFPEFGSDIQVGDTPDVFTSALETSHALLDDLTYPYQTDIQIGGMLVELTVTQIPDDEGNIVGYVLEHSDASEDRKNHALLNALEQAQIRADFDGTGVLVHLNDGFLASLQIAEIPATCLKEFLFDENGSDAWNAVSEGSPIFGKFAVNHENSQLLIDGSISPTQDRHGRTTGFVALGTDVTAAETKLREATEASERMAAAQAKVVNALQDALKSLARGNLKIRVNDELTEEYEVLRNDFNSAVAALDSAISEILDSSDTILGEADNVSSAADDLSRRTEQQAATLEETAAAISQLSASVASAASEAKQANDVVTQARTNASASGEVVQQAVDAMGEIATSSEQISRIIGVIDEIAFQTNLLALNAGVEAARAGDAGRGFAVVASEVRALAQRSSQAAREITDLISTSGEQVKKGVSLVDKAGHALTDIVGSVGDIAEHVSAIAASAREQSTSVEEINSAMNQLDQVTQKNVAMFEETMAASQTVTAEANSLVGITSQFDSNRASKPAAAREGTGFESIRRKPRETPQRASVIASPPVSGNLAIELQDDADLDWEEF